MNNCFSIYHTSWITSGPKNNFISSNIAAKAILFFFGCSEVNSTWLITSELANQRTQKVLFTCLVYTKTCILLCTHMLLVCNRMYKTRNILFLQTMNERRGAPCKEGGRFLPSSINHPAYVYLFQHRDLVIRSGFSLRFSGVVTSFLCCNIPVFLITIELNVFIT